MAGVSENRKALILIADDQEFMRKMIRDSLNNSEYELIEADNGKDAVRLFNQYKPDVVLLDAIMPVMDGFAACEHIRNTDVGKRTPILMITALGDTKSINLGFKVGVNDFIQKPLNLDILQRRLSLLIKEKNNDEKLRKSEERFRLLAENARDCIVILKLNPFQYEYISPVIKSITGYRAEEFCLNHLLIKDIIYPVDRKVIDYIITGQVDCKLPIEVRLLHKEGHIIYSENHIVPIFGQNRQLLGLQIISRDITQRKKDEVRKRIELTQKVLYKTVQALSATIETRDPYTSGHQHRVAQLAVQISKALGVNADQQEGIQTAALLHDIGKITVPAEYLSKPGRLSETEFNVIKTHSIVGYEILKPIEFPWPIAEIVHQHHERSDGSGYPCGLSGDRILPETRIIAVADVVEAMASHRPYRVALGIEHAIEEIENNLDKLYDSLVANTCIELLKSKKFSFLSADCT